MRERAERAFDRASIGGVKTVVIFGRGSLHNRFTRQPPLADQLSLAADHLRPVAEAASERDIQLALLPHLDYRGHEMVSVMEKVCHPNLMMAFDTTNPFPVCEEPVAAAKVVLPHAVAVAFKDVQIYPDRSNDVTIWGTPIGRGSVDFETLLPMLSERLPDPEKTTACIKLRLPPGSAEHADWMGPESDLSAVAPGSGWRVGRILPGAWAVNPLISCSPDGMNLSKLLELPIGVVCRVPVWNLLCLFQSLIRHAHMEHLRFIHRKRVHLPVKIPCGATSAPEQLTRQHPSGER